MNLGLFGRGNRKETSGQNVMSEAPSDAFAVRLQQECAQATARFRTPTEFGYDPDEHRWWMMLGEVALPENMSQSHTPVLVLVSSKYPAEGPTDIFLPKSLNSKGGWRVQDVIGACGEEAAKGDWVRCEIPGIVWRETDDLCRLIETLLAIIAGAQKATVTLSVEPSVDN